MRSRSDIEEDVDIRYIRADADKIQALILEVLLDIRELLRV